MKFAFWKQALTIQVAPPRAKQIHVIRLKPAHAVCFALLAVILWSSISGAITAGTKARDRQIRQLTLATSQQAKHLARLAREKEQISNLMARENQELARKLGALQAQAATISKIVGVKPGAVPKADSVKPAAGRHLSSRGGITLNQHMAQFRNLSAGVAQTEQTLAALQGLAEQYRAAKQKEQLLAAMAAIPSLRPVSGGYISSHFGWRNSPWGGGSDNHPGVDICAPYGSPISATGAGAVVQSGWQQGYGNCVTIDHGNGWKTLYGHCSALAVSQGDTVKKGQLIAYLGSTGSSTGPHVHYQVWHNGVLTDPMVCLSPDQDQILRFAQQTLQSIGN